MGDIQGDTESNPTHNAVEYEEAEDWNDYIEDEGDAIIKKVIAQQKENDKLEKLRQEITIEFRPTTALENMIPQICGDMTEWIPVNMHPVDQSESE